MLPDETDPLRRSVVQAMRRVLDGNPKVVPPGRISISAVADEAGIPRNHLNRQYDDLRIIFLAILAELEHSNHVLPASPAKVAALEALVADQQSIIRELRTSRRDWKTAAEVFIRKNQGLSIELTNVRRQIDNHTKRAKRQEDTIEKLQADSRTTRPIIPLERRHRRPPSERF